jgi:hypothetical protein
LNSLFVHTLLLIMILRSSKATIPTKSLCPMSFFDSVNGSIGAFFGSFGLNSSRQHPDELPFAPDVPIELPSPIRRELSDYSDNIQDGDDRADEVAPVIAPACSLHSRLFLASSELSITRVVLE